MGLPEPPDLDARIASAWRAAGGDGLDEAWRALRLLGRGELERALELAASPGELDAALDASARAFLVAQPAIALRARIARALDARDVADVPRDVPATGLRRLLRAVGRLPDADAIDDTTLEAALERMLAAADGPVPRRRLERALCHAAGVTLIDDESAASDVRHWLADDPGRPCFADIWLTAGPAPQTVLLIDDGHEAAPGSIVHDAVLVDSRLDDASWLHLRLEAGETTLRTPLRVCLDVQYDLGVASLDRRVGRLTAAGLVTLDRSNLGLLSDDRFGVPPQTGLPATAIPGASALAAIATGELVPDGDRDFAEPEVLGALDAAWPAPVVLDDRTTAIVDLLAGDAQPAVVLGARSRGEVGVVRPGDGGASPNSGAGASVLRDGDAAAAVRALALAEARVARNPYGLWVLDAAVAATRLRTATGGAFAGLAHLAATRARQVAERTSRLPPAVLDRWNPNDPALEALRRSVRALATETHDQDVARWLDAWVAALDRAGDDDTWAGTPPAAEPLTSFLRAQHVPVDLDLAISTLAETPPMVVAEPAADGSTALRLPVRPPVVRAAQAADAGQLALALRGGDRELPPVWLQSFEPDTGIVRHSVLLVLESDELRGLAPVPVEPARSVVRRRPSGVVVPFELLGSLLTAMAEERSWVARLLLDAADGFSAPDVRTLLLRGAQAAVGPTPGAVADAVSTRLAAFAVAPPPGRLPSDAEASVAAPLIARCRAVRDELATAPRRTATVVGDVRRLDDLLH